MVFDKYSQACFRITLALKAFVKALDHRVKCVLLDQVEQLLLRLK